MIFSPNARYVAVYNIFVLTALLTKPVAAESLMERSTLNTRIESEWGVLINPDSAKNGSTQKLQLMIEPELKIDIGEDASITTTARLRTDAKDKLSPHDHSQAELREFYLDTTISDSILILGKQQVVWGKSDGLKVLDIINPQNFRELSSMTLTSHVFPCGQLMQKFPLTM